MCVGARCALRLLACLAGRGRVAERRCAAAHRRERAENQTDCSSGSRARCTAAASAVAMEEEDGSELLAAMRADAA